MHSLPGRVHPAPHTNTLTLASGSLHFEAEDWFPLAHLPRNAHEQSEGRQQTFPTCAPPACVAQTLLRLIVSSAVSCSVILDYGEKQALWARNSRNHGFMDKVDVVVQLQLRGKCRL